MPKKTKKPKKIAAASYTHETESYVQGAYSELRTEVHRYHELIQLQLQTEARITLTEQKICLTRDHLVMTLDECDGTAAPRDWTDTFYSIRFVGVRLGDACMSILSDHKKLTSKELLDYLDKGMFRFRTSAPLREIHAAMIQQPQATRIGDHWVWHGDREVQMNMRLRANRTVLKAVAGTTVVPKRKDGTA